MGGGEGVEVLAAEVRYVVVRGFAVLAANVNISSGGLQNGRHRDVVEGVHKSRFKCPR